MPARKPIRRPVPGAINRPTTDKWGHGAINRATAPPAGPAPLRPPLKWAGGKRWLVPLLRPLWEPYRERRLVEPLCGGLAVALGLMPARALVNDISPHTTNFYRHLKRGLCVTIPMR